MTLAELVERRLEAAGIGPDDPGLVQLREWNSAAAERWQGPPRRSAADVKAWRGASSPAPDTAKP